MTSKGRKEKCAMKWMGMALALLAVAGCARDASSASLDAALSRTTCFVRIGRGDGAVERFSELGPHGWTEIARELLRFAASLGELRPEPGERAACCDWARDM